jgi:pyruvate dehydrogenase E1 component alpha subunit
MHVALSEAAKLAREGKGATLIEAVTYRKGAHTTSDDPTKYRTKEEEMEWDKTDPLFRLKKYLKSKKLFTDKEEDKLTEQYKKEVERQFVEAENYGPYPIEDVFQYHYEDMPQDMAAQKNDYERFLKWKEARK